MKLQVIVGSTRPGRASDKVVPWVAALHNARAAGELVPGKIGRAWRPPRALRQRRPVSRDPGGPLASRPAARARLVVRVLTRGTRDGKRSAW